MRSLLRTTLAVSMASVALAACSDQPTSEPTAPTPPRTIPTGVNRAELPLQLLACNTNQLKTDARAFAKRASDLTAVINDLQTEVSKNGQTRKATHKAFDGLALVAAIRGTGDQKTDVTAAIFNSLVKGFLACMEPAVTFGALEPTPPGGPDGFGLALGSGWMLEVRGGTGSEGAYERNKPPAPATYWATEPDAASWAAAISGYAGGTEELDRALLYGYRTSPPGTNGQIGSSFEHRSIPFIDKTNKSRFSINADIGLCGIETTVADPERVSHDYKVGAFASLTCSPPPEAILSSSSSYAFGRLNPMPLVQRAVSFFAPQPLYAAAFFGGIGTSTDYLSPSVVYDLSQVVLTFVGTIANDTVNSPLNTTTGTPVTIRATLANGDSVPGLQIKVAIAGNSSTIAFFNDNGAPAVDLTRTTDSHGNVELTGVSLVKAGGYTLSTFVYFDSVTGPSFLSNSFNIQNKSLP